MFFFALHHKPYRMAIGNGELMHECFPKHSRKETARMKQTKKIREGRVWKEVKQARKKKEVSTA